MASGVPDVLSLIEAARQRRQQNKQLDFDKLQLKESARRTDILDQNTDDLNRINQGNLDVRRKESDRAQAAFDLELASQIGAGVLIPAEDGKIGPSTIEFKGKPFRARTPEELAQLEGDTAAVRLKNAEAQIGEGGLLSDLPPHLKNMVKINAALGRIPNSGVPFAAPNRSTGSVEQQIKNQRALALLQGDQDTATELGGILDVINPRRTQAPRQDPAEKDADERGSGVLQFLLLQKAKDTPEKIKTFFLTPGNEPLIEQLKQEFMTTLGISGPNAEAIFQNSASDLISGRPKSSRDLLLEEIRGAFRGE